MATNAGLPGNDATLANTWPKIACPFKKLLRQQVVPRKEWFDLFSRVNKVILWDNEEAPEGMKKKIEVEIETYTQEVQDCVLLNHDDECLLRGYTKEWGVFFIQCSIVYRPFEKLDETFITQSSTSGPKIKDEKESRVRKLMLDTWNKTIFSNIRERLQNSVMNLVEAERNGKSFDTQLVIAVRESFVKLCSDETKPLKIYDEHFDKPYRKACEQFYGKASQEYETNNGIVKYMAWADEKLNDEKKRAERYLATSENVETLMKDLITVLVQKYQTQILDECAGMIKRNETKELALMFTVVDRRDGGVNRMLEDLEIHIIEQGLKDMMESAEVITTDCEQYVNKLLKLFECFSTLVKEAFHEDSRFLSSRDKAFKQVVNDTSIFKLELPSKSRMVGAKTQPESKCPELLANFSDLLLRKCPTSKKMTSEEVLNKGKGVALVLKYVSNKDVFMRFYKAHLTRRLILQTSADNYMEEEMLNQLRDVGMPAEWMNSLQRMFQDIGISKDLNDQFKDAKRESGDAFIANAININVLNAGAWGRSSDRCSVTLPNELAELIPQIEEFYSSKHTGRRLCWYHALGNGSINFENKIGKYELEVTTMQMAILFAWNERPTEKINFHSLVLATELPENELKRTLASLCMNTKLKKQMLLTEVKSPRDIKNDTEFWINQEFGIVKGGKLQKRGKMSLIGKLQLSTEASKKEDEDAIIALREMRIQEAVVKIMKTRKTLSNAALQTELVQMLKNQFIPQKKMMKDQIEWLIEENYIKRSEQDVNTFIYLA